MMQNLLLFVTYTAKPGMRDRFVQEIFESGVLEKIRREDGCLGYDYYLSAEKEDEILLIEKWTSKEQQQIHLTQPHMEILKSVKNECIAETKLESF